MYVKDPSTFPDGSLTNKKHEAEDSDFVYDVGTDCPAAAGRQEDFDWMKVMEENFSCSGVCTSPGYYVFTDINRGFPDDTCLNKLIDFTDSYSYYVALVAGGIALYLLITILFACCLCCEAKKDPDNLGTSYYNMQNQHYNYRR